MALVVKASARWLVRVLCWSCCVGERSHLSDLAMGGSLAYHASCCCFCSNNVDDKLAMDDDAFLTLPRQLKLCSTEKKIALDARVG